MGEALVKAWRYSSGQKSRIKVFVYPRSPGVDPRGMPSYSCMALPVTIQPTLCSLPPPRIVIHDFLEIQSE